MAAGKRKREQAPALEAKLSTKINVLGFLEKSRKSCSRLGFRAAIPVTLYKYSGLAGHQRPIRSHGVTMTHQKFEGERTPMRIHIGESDKWHGKPLHEAIVEMLRKDGFSGATVLRGVGGYGGSGRHPTDKLLRLAPDLPIIPEGIGSSQRIDAILP